MNYYKQYPSDPQNYYAYTRQTNRQTEMDQLVWVGKKHEQQHHFYGEVQTGQTEKCTITKHSSNGRRSVLNWQEKRLKEIQSKKGWDRICGHRMKGRNGQVSHRSSERVRNQKAVHGRTEEIPPGNQTVCRWLYDLCCCFLHVNPHKPVSSYWGRGGGWGHSLEQATHFMQTGVLDFLSCRKYGFLVQSVTNPMNRSCFGCLCITT